MEQRNADGSQHLYAARPVITEETILSLKEQKELFVTGHDGSTAWEVLLVCFAVPIGIWLFQSIRHLQFYLDERGRSERRRCVTSSKNVVTGVSKPTMSTLLIEALVLWLPMLICQTIWIYPWGLIVLWSEAQVSLLIFIYFWSIRRLTAMSRKNGTTIKEHLDTVMEEDADADEMDTIVQKHGYLHMKDIMTVYRASLLYMTFIAILAVDFHLFPRRFAKTEVSGYGLMDLGAASFVLAAGLVSPRARYQGDDRERKVCFGKKDAYRILPLLALGFIRLATNKGLEYQEHVSEYGVHWNFFFTLAIVTPLGSIMPGRPSWILPILLMGSYQYALVGLGWQDFIENSPRNRCNIPFLSNTVANKGFLEYLCTLIVANREGVLGCIGYLSLYLSGEYIAYAFLWTKSNNRQQPFLLMLTAVLWLTLYGLESQLHIPVSRRSTNAAFCVWTLAHNMVLLAGIRAVYSLYQDVQQLASKRQAKGAPIRPPVPVLFQAVNQHGFLSFLVANLLTGLTNLSINTLKVKDSLALLIIAFYLSAVGGLSLILSRTMHSDGKNNGGGNAAKQKKE